MSKFHEGDTVRVVGHLHRYGNKQFLPIGWEGVARLSEDELVVSEGADGFRWLVKGGAHLFDLVRRAGKDADPESYTARIAAAAAQALAEAEREAKHWPEFRSAHEGFAVLLEEVDELKAHVWTSQKKRDLAAMQAEAIQVAAMAIRFAASVCGEAKGRL